jgi:hypothetical protein
VLFADSQILLAKSEEPQYSLYSSINRPAVFSVEIHTELKVWLLKEQNQLEARSLLMTGYWNKFILLIIWAIICPVREKRILK